MRLLTLYARARGVPAALLGTAVLAVLVVAADTWLSRHADLIRPAEITTIVLTALIAAILVAGTLTGADDALEDTTPLSWAWWRAGQLVLVLGAAAVLLGLAGREAAVLGGPGAVVRDAVGYAGIAALGTALCGATAGWAAPLAYMLVTYATAPERADGVAARIWAFHLQPGPDAVARATAAALLVAGLLAYSVRGARVR
jgi:hypothetical protein